MKEMRELFLWMAGLDGCRQKWECKALRWERAGRFEEQEEGL